MVNKQFEAEKYDGVFNPIVFSEVSPDSKILDVGCWKGGLGKALIKKKSCVVDGVDLNPEALEVASQRGYREVYDFDLNQGNLDKLPLEETYDYIVFADVLEHLINPAEVLEAFAPFLSKEGRIIISIPNIAFIKQRWDLLWGKFEYNPSGGIMDEKHLRFYTYSSFKDLVNNAGFRVKKSYGYSLVKPRFKFLKPLSKLFPSLFALQFIFVLES
ncbi:methyltransferase domain-containing protein [candidate division WWE3 bacterium]|nr:methyltransferase domain-containing protein [candidate division WWE3 bacterium]